MMVWLSKLSTMAFILMSEYMFYLAAVLSTLGLSDPVSSTINFFDSMKNTHLLAYPITKSC